MSIFNITTRKVGGIRFLKVGRINFSFCISRKPVLKNVWAGSWGDQAW